MPPGSAKYDRLGATYASTRQADPRVQAAIWDALGDARSVVNVGAGAGSYEPPQTILAVEPSLVMIAQRPSGLAPVAVTTAARIPLPDGAVDAALCSLTIHHWDDLDAGFAEIRRVARRVVIFTWDQQVYRDYWLVKDYFPGIAAYDDERAVPIARLAEAFPGARVIPVPVPHDCTDGFLGAFWRRPEAYLDPLVRAGASGFSTVGDQETEEGLQRLVDDLGTGEWRRKYGHLLEQDAADLGYRLVVADWE
ncbi:MAG: class I SAM-dependent methyltransferase [Dehalococcoidia bacterium]|nr:class I SAM-dependent methyltransferase [Dehalococcoidia bacterium]